MIIDTILDKVQELILYIISLVPIAPSSPNWLSSSLSIISKGLTIFPSDVWIIVLTNISAWIVIQYTWAIIEWVYKKIPGVD